MPVGESCRKGELREMYNTKQSVLTSLASLYRRQTSLDSVSSSVSGATIRGVDESPYAREEYGQS